MEMSAVIFLRAEARARKLRVYAFPASKAMPERTYCTCQPSFPVPVTSMATAAPGTSPFPAGFKADSDAAAPWWRSKFHPAPPASPLIRAFPGGEPMPRASTIAPREP
jgi:hypothetical protein